MGAGGVWNREWSMGSPSLLGTYGMVRKFGFRGEFRGTLGSGIFLFTVMSYVHGSDII